MTAQMSVRIPLALKFSLAHSLFRGGGVSVYFVIINNKNVKKHSARIKKNYFFLRSLRAKFLIRVLELVDRENLSFSDIIS